ncbi:MULTISPECIES: hypothetical protein [Winogradskyella]|uniref:hypothetical protein n=1 Tax=Winogradskyella TaxID=286104 RepID=UPI0015C96870|nr:MULTISPECIES: hypothetical protein [Winogradskyella]QXP79015.1 hypothetical protein H0I32_17750 [Winogradskyella sp. HaHa_3_26]
MKKIILLTLLLNCGIGISQNEFPNGQKNESFSSYNENWEFFELDEPIEVRILLHLPSSGLCGHLAFASVSIVQTKDEKTFRILDLCNTKDIPENKIVKIIPSKKPEFSVLLPSRTFINPKTGKVEAFELDKKTLKTTYGNIETE